VILLQDTVERNLTWVRSAPPSAAELEKSIQCAELSSVILRLKEGLATIVGRREGGLSGGECQRLAIARELLRNPNLLVLDEATNALDVDTEARVLRNIREHYPKLTILIVAHRESATALADRVIAMREGTDAAED
jgi:ATP-binding cassette subfamily C protein